MNMNTKKFTGREKEYVIGYFDSEFTSSLAVDKLKTSGFDEKEIKIEVHNAPAKVTTDQTLMKTEVKEKSFGFSLVGIVLGGIIGWLVGIGFFRHAPKTLTDSGPFILSLIGLVIGGILTGFIGALFGMRGPKYRPLEKQVIMKISCNNSDWANRAKKLLEVAGAHNINSINEELPLAY